MDGECFFYRKDTDTKNYYQIIRKYYPSGAIKEESTRLDNKYLTREIYYKNGVKKMNLVVKDDLIKRYYYDLNSNLTKETWRLYLNNNNNDYFEYLKLYKNNVLIQETTKFKDKLDGFSIDYDNNGNFLSEIYYEDGNKEFVSYCPFETMGYSEKLELKHKGYFAYRTRNITYCKKIEKDKYFMVTSYDANTHEGETPKYLDVMVSVIDTKNRKILASFYDDKANLDFEEQFSIDKFTRRAKTNPNVIDVINEIHVGRWETEKLYNSYKVVMGKIIPLAKEKINLKEIEKQAKEGKHFTSDELIGIVNEKPIVEKNVIIYNDIGYYLQKHGFHDEALTLFKEILTYFPNRAVLLLNIGDSAWELKENKLAKTSYKKYIKLMKAKGKQKKIPKKVYLRLGE